MTTSDAPVASTIAFIFLATARRAIWRMSIVAAMIAAAAPSAHSLADGADPADSSSAIAPDTTLKPSVPRLVLIGAGTVAGFVGGHVLGQELWWKGERAAFHFEWDRDWRYSLGADKLGHAWFPYIIGSAYRDLLLWSRLDSATAVWTAASLAMGYQTFVEVRDGFSAQWGFSLGDYAADLLGAALPVAQHYVPELRIVQLKVSYYPSEVWRAGAHRAIIDDYESTYHWLSVRLGSLLPSPVADWYPAFIDVAVGHSVKGLDGSGGGTHELYIALDWNLDAFGGDWWPWSLLRGVLRHYHLPAPSLRLYPGPVRFGLLL